MDGFTGFKTATTELLPDAVTVMDPFRVVRLAGDALDQGRRRIRIWSIATAAVDGVPGNLDQRMARLLAELIGAGEQRAAS